MLRIRKTLEELFEQRLGLYASVEGDGDGGGGGGSADGDGAASSDGSGSLLDKSVGDGGDKSGGDGEGDKSGQGETAWFIADGVPGEGEPPEGYDKTKYKSVVDQLKAHNEATKKLSQKDELRGAPEKYELKLSDDVLSLFPEEDRAKANDSDFAPQLFEWGSKWDLPNEAINELFSAYNKYEFEEQPDPKVEIAALGDNAGELVARVGQYIENTVGKEGDLHDEAMFLTSTAKGVKLVEAFMKANPASQVGEGDGTPAGDGLPSKAELKEMMEATNEQGQRKMSVDKAYNRQVTALYNKVYGTKPKEPQAVDISPGEG